MGEGGLWGGGVSHLTVQGRKNFPAALGPKWNQLWPARHIARTGILQNLPGGRGRAGLGGFAYKDRARPPTPLRRVVQPLPSAASFVWPAWWSCKGISWGDCRGWGVEAESAVRKWGVRGAPAAVPPGTTRHLQRYGHMQTGGVRATCHNAPLFERTLCGCPSAPWQTCPRDPAIPTKCPLPPNSVPLALMVWQSSGGGPA